MLAPMRSLSLLVLCALPWSACATVHVDRAAAPAARALAARTLAVAPPSAAEERAVAALAAAPATGASAAPALARPVAPGNTSAAAPKLLLGGGGYTRVSIGTFQPSGDIDALDSGYYAQVAFGTDLLPILAIEAAVGYLSADGSSAGELAAVPVFVQGRLQIPVAILELYGGAGVGGMFADYELGLADDSEFVYAHTAFLGAEVGLGRVALGLEYRYLASEDTDPGFAIEGHCGLVCLTLPF